MTKPKQQTTSSTEDYNNGEKPADPEKTPVDEGHTDPDSEDEDADTDKEDDDKKDSPEKTIWTVGPRAFEHLRETPSKRPSQNDTASPKTKRLRRLQSQLSYDYKDEPALWGKRL